MARAVTKTFETTAENSEALYVRKGDSFTYLIDFSADWDGRLYLEKTTNGQFWTNVRTWLSGSKTDISTAVLVLNDVESATYQFHCELQGETLTGTAAITMTEIDATLQEIKSPDGATIFKMTEAGTTIEVKPSVEYHFPAAKMAKVGATAGWVVGAADDIALVTLPASQTASTLVVPIHAPIGATITGFHLIGQIESAGGAVTVDAALKKHTAAAADVAVASVGAITQLAVSADTIMSSANTAKTGLTEVIGEDETFFVLITATTAGSTDIALQGVSITYDEV
jgi:hypothetical protein